MNFCTGFVAGWNENHISKSINKTPGVLRIFADMVGGRQEKICLEQVSNELWLLVSSWLDLLTDI